MVVFLFCYNCREILDSFSTKLNDSDYKYRCMNCDCESIFDFGTYPIPVKVGPKMINDKVKKKIQKIAKDIFGTTFNSSFSYPHCRLDVYSQYISIILKDDCTINILKINELSKQLGTDKIDIVYKASEPGYSEYTPGSPEILELRIYYPIKFIDEDYEINYYEEPES